MIEVWKEQVGNGEHFGRLLAFCGEVIGICAEVGITPVLSGSLAVSGYTQDSEKEIHDIDLACPELEFPGLRHTLKANGIRSELRPWHVVQALREDLLVEFDSTYRLDQSRDWSSLAVRYRS